MRYYAVLLPMIDVEKSIQYRTQHLKYLEDMRNAGHIIANGRFADGNGGMVIYRANSIDEVTEFAKKDPYVVHNARVYFIHEWELVLNEALLHIE